MKLAELFNPHPETPKSAADNGVSNYGWWMEPALRTKGSAIIPRSPQERHLSLETIFKGSNYPASDSRKPTMISGTFIHSELLESLGLNQNSQNHQP